VRGRVRIRRRRRGRRREGGKGVSRQVRKVECEEKIWHMRNGLLSRRAS
jgi:hypothetical protein